MALFLTATTMEKKQKQVLVGICNMNDILRKIYITLSLILLLNPILLQAGGFSAQARQFLGWSESNKINKGDRVLGLQPMQILSKGALAWRNGVRWIAENPKKTLSLLLFAQSPSLAASKLFNINGYESVSASGCPHVAVRPDGNFFVSWLSENGTANVRLMSKDGECLNSIIALATNITNIPEIASYKDNSAIALWHNENSQYFFRYLNSNGEIRSDIIAFDAPYNIVRLYNLKSGKILLGASQLENAQCRIDGYEIDSNATINAIGAISNTLDEAQAPCNFALIDDIDGNIYTAVTTQNSVYGFVRKFSNFAITLCQQKTNLFQPPHNPWLTLVANSLILGWTTFSDGVSQLQGREFSSALCEEGSDIYPAPMFFSEQWPGEGAIFNNGDNALFGFVGQYNPTDVPIVYILYYDGFRFWFPYPIFLNLTNNPAAQYAISATLPDNSVIVVASFLSNFGLRSSLHGIKFSGSEIQSIYAAPSSTSGNNGSSDPSFFSSIAAKVGFSVGSAALSAITFLSGMTWKMYTAKKYRESKKFHDLLRQKLKLSVWDFNSEDGRDYCEMVKVLLEHLRDNFADSGISFDINKCDEMQLHALAFAFAKTLENHKFVTLTNRELTRFCLKERVTLNDLICEKKNTEIIVSDVIKELQKDQSLYAALTAQVQTYIQKDEEKSVAVDQSNGVAIEMCDGSMGMKSNSANEISKNIGGTIRLASIGILDYLKKQTQASSFAGRICLRLGFAELVAESEEGRAFNAVIKSLLDALTQQFMDAGVVFDLDKCSYVQQDAMAQIFANALKSQDLAFVTPRSVKNFFSQQCEIFINKIVTPDAIKAFTETIMLELKKDADLFQGLIANCPAEQLSPISKRLVHDADIDDFPIDAMPVKSPPRLPMLEEKVRSDAEDIGL